MNDLVEGRAPTDDTFDAVDLAVDLACSLSLDLREQANPCLLTRTTPYFCLDIKSRNPLLFVVRSALFSHL